LLRQGLRYWLESGHIAFPLTIFSIAEYEIGARILGLMGFSRVKSGESMPDGCDLYRMEIASKADAIALLKQRGL
jgi:hypothetical protein